MTIIVTEMPVMDNSVKQLTKKLILFGKYRNFNYKLKTWVNLNMTSLEPLCLAFWNFSLIIAFFINYGFANADSNKYNIGNLQYDPKYWLYFSFTLFTVTLKSGKKAMEINSLTLWQNCLTKCQRAHKNFYSMISSKQNQIFVLLTQQILADVTFWTKASDFHSYCWNSKHSQWGEYIGDEVNYML